jgi:pseudoazurin
VKGAAPAFRENDMTQTRRDHLATLAGAAAGLTLAPLAGRAQDGESKVHEVLMLNQDPETGDRQVFEPALLRVQPGDTVRFVAEDRGHNSQVNEDLMPEGGETWEGRINEEVEVTLETEGTYAYYCRPHQTAGMVGLILVGDPSSNYEEVKDGRFRGLARRRYEELFAQADELLASEGS